jgi:hypothetical protein
MSNSFSELSGSLFGGVIQSLKEGKKTNIYQKITNWWLYNI